MRSHLPVVSEKKKMFKYASTTEVLQVMPHYFLITWAQKTYNTNMYITLGLNKLQHTF